MSSALRVRVGLYGLLFHVVVVLAALGVGAANRAPVDFRFWAMATPALLLASFPAYALLVAPYVARRGTRRGVAIWDMAIGMAVEPVIVLVATVLFSAASAAPALRDGAGAFAAALGGSLYVSLLWTVANFMTHILALGNAAGFLGFVLLKRFAARAQQA